MARHTWKSEEIDFLRENAFGRSYKEIVQMFNKHFNLDLSEVVIVGVMKRFRIITGRTKESRFKKGHVPFNKGMKGVFFGGSKGKKTQFKKGHTENLRHPVGTERLNHSGYIQIKVANPDVWKLKHIHLWEQVNGPIPHNHVLLFLDRNKQNVSLDNLQLVSRSLLLRLNESGLIYENPEATKTGIILAEIYNKIGQRKKEVK